MFAANLLQLGVWGGVCVHASMSPLVSFLKVYVQKRPTAFSSLLLPPASICMHVCVYEHWYPGVVQRALDWRSEDMGSSLGSATKSVCDFGETIFLLWTSFSPFVKQGHWSRLL